MEDNKIIDLFWTRDQMAIEETGIKYGSRLQRLATKILYSREDAEESVNDTYLAAWNTIPPQRPVYFFAFLAKICRLPPMVNWTGKLPRNVRRRWWN